jgi:hypothetical protein
MCTGSGTTVARVVRFGSSLITVPLTLKYLGNKRFALWMTIRCVLAMAAFADFGIGNGVLDTVAEASGKDNKEGSARPSHQLCDRQCDCLLVIRLFALYRFNWEFFPCCSPQARSEGRSRAGGLRHRFMLNISTDVVQRVQLG